MKKLILYLFVLAFLPVQAQKKKAVVKKKPSVTVLDYFFPKNIPENAVYFFNGDEARYEVENQNDTIVQRLSVSDCCTGAIYQKPTYYLVYNKPTASLQLLQEIVFGHQATSKGSKRKVKNYEKNRFLYENDTWLLLPKPEQSITIQAYRYEQEQNKIEVQRTFSWGQISIENDTKPSRKCLIVSDKWQNFVLERYYVYQWGLVRSELKETELEEIEKFSLSFIKE